MSSKLNLFFSTYLEINEEGRIETHILMKKFNQFNLELKSMRQFCTIWRKTYPNLKITKSNSRYFCTGISFIAKSEKIEKFEYSMNQDPQQTESKFERVHSERNLVQLELDRLKLELEKVRANKIQSSESQVDDNLLCEFNRFQIENAQLQLKNKDLKSENKKIKSDFEKLQSENLQLKATIDKYLPISDNPKRPIIREFLIAPIPLEVKKGKRVMPPSCSKRKRNLSKQDNSKHPLRNQASFQSKLNEI